MDEKNEEWRVCFFLSCYQPLNNLILKEEINIHVVEENENCGRQRSRRNCGCDGNWSSRDERIRCKECCNGGESFPDNSMLSTE